MTTNSASKEEWSKYLDPEFDPSSLTVNELVSFLSAHDIPIPPNRSKKDVYVKLFQDSLHIIKKNILLKEKASRKIRTISTSVPKTPRSARKTKQQPVESMDDAETTETIVPTRRTSPRRKRQLETTVNAVIDSEAESDTTLAAGPSGKSSDPTKTPRHRKKLAPNTTETVFSDENPFQEPAPPAVSSPLSPKKGSSRRSKKLDPKKLQDMSPENPSLDSKHMEMDFTDSNTIPEFSTPVKPTRAGQPRKTSRKSPQSLSEVMKHLEEKDTAGTPASTRKRFMNMDFVASLASEATYATSSPFKSPPPTLVDVLQAPDISHLSPKKGPKNITKVPTSLSSRAIAFVRAHLVVTLLLLGLGYFALLWTTNDYPHLQYCNTDTSSRPETVDFNPWRYVLPSCINCPDHTICEGRSVIDCESVQYKLQSPLLIRFLPRTILPFPFDQLYCLPDTEKIRAETRRKRLIQKGTLLLNELVRTWIGKAQCGSIRPVGDDASEISWAWSSQTRQVRGMPLQLAKDSLKKLMGNRWSDEDFDSTWTVLQDKLLIPNASENTEDVFPLYTVLDDHKHLFRLIVSQNDPIMSLSCQVRLYTWGLVKDHALSLLLSGLGIIVAFYVQMTRAQSQRERSVIESLLQDVLDAVHAETENFDSDPIRHPIPGLAVSQLYDHFLPSAIPESLINQVPNDSFPSLLDPHGRHVFYVPSEHVRNRIWTSMSKQIVKNSCIRETVMEVKGESLTVWMWVGSHVLSPKRVKPQAQGVIGSEIKGIFSQNRVDEVPRTPSKPSSFGSSESSFRPFSGAVNLESEILYPTLNAASDSVSSLKQ